METRIGKQNNIEMGKYLIVETFVYLIYKFYELGSETLEAI